VRADAKGAASTAAALLGSRGGRARAAAQSAEERTEQARRAALGPLGEAEHCRCGAMTIERAKQRGHVCPA
jgi:hypothetical protein